MPSLNMFARLGLFMAPGFLDTELCTQFRSELRVSTQRQTNIIGGGVNAVNENIRSSKYGTVSTPTSTTVHARLLALKPELENHFNVRLSGCEKPSFLVYRAGDFQLAHRDRSDDPCDPAFIRQRQLSAIIFLNNCVEVPGEDTYGGGAFTFYGLLPGPRWTKCGLPFIGEAGLLMVFRSNEAHEVKPVTFGERYTIVAWFF